MSAGATVRAFWEAMNGNDWAGVAARFLAPGFTAIWPQSGEVIEGAADFAKVNAAFPGQGGWRFEVIEVVEQGDRAVSDVRVTNGGTVARVVTFHEVADGRIRAQREFWPDAYPVPDWRLGLLRVDPDRAAF